MNSDIRLTLAVAAEKSIAPVAAQVTKLQKSLARIEHTAAVESGKVAKTADEIENLKRIAGESLTGNPNDYEKFKVNIRKLTVKLATSQEIVALLTKDIIPQQRRELDAARQKLEREFAALAASARSDCENRLTELLGAVIAEHDEFMAAISELGRTFGTVFRGEPPKVYHGRVAEVKHTVMRRWVTFKAAPPISAAQAAPVAPDTPATLPAVPVPTQPTCVESPPTGEKALGVESTSPRAAMIAPEHCAAAAECPTGAAAPLSPDANRARVLLRRSPTATETPPDPADESPAPTPLEPIPAAVCAEAAVTGTRGEGAPVENPPEAAPTDLDPDTPAPDPLPLDVEAEAPPVAGEKENPGIVAEGT